MKDQKYNNLETDVIDAKESDYLFIKTSQIPFTESGLYTALAIYKNEIIAIFKGESITNIEAAKRAKQNQNHYFVCLPDGGMLDSMHVKCFAKYANDAEGFTKSKFKNKSQNSGGVSLNSKDGNDTSKDQEWKYDESTSGKRKDWCICIKSSLLLGSKKKAGCLRKRAHGGRQGRRGDIQEVQEDGRSHQARWWRPSEECSKECTSTLCHPM